MLFNNFDLTDEEILKIINDYEPLIKRNLLAGIFRGVGIGVGITIISAILIIVLQRVKF